MQSSDKKCSDCNRKNTIGNDNKCVECVNAFISGQKSGYSYKDINAAIRRYGERSSFSGGHMLDGWALAEERKADEKILRAIGWW
jgi:hypothetical protein